MSMCSKIPLFIVGPFHNKTVYTQTGTRDLDNAFMARFKKRLLTHVIPVTFNHTGIATIIDTKSDFGGISDKIINSGLAIGFVKRIYKAIDGKWYAHMIVFPDSILDTSSLYLSLTNGLTNAHEIALVPCPSRDVGRITCCSVDEKIVRGYIDSTISPDDKFTDPTFMMAQTSELAKMDVDCSEAQLTEFRDETIARAQAASQKQVDNIRHQYIKKLEQLRNNKNISSTSQSIQHTQEEERQMKEAIKQLSEFTSKLNNHHGFTPVQQPIAAYSSFMQVRDLVTNVAGLVQHIEANSNTDTSSKRKRVDDQTTHNPLPSAGTNPFSFIDLNTTAF